MTNNGPDVKKAVQELLDAVNIERAVYVDDIFCVTDERLISLCDALNYEQTKSLGVFFDILVETDEDVLRYKVQKKIIETKKAERLDTLTKLARLLRQEEIQNDFDAASALKGVLPPKVGLIELSLNEWNSEKKSIIEKTSKYKTLFIFDDDFSREPGGTNVHGRRLITELSAVLGEKEFITCLLTHKKIDERGEQTLTEEIISENGELRDKIVVIAKSRLSGDKAAFPYKLKLTLLRPKFERIKDALSHTLTEAQSTAKKEIDDLRVDAFERIVFRSSMEEGSWALDTLLSLHNILQEKKAMSALHTSPDTHALARDAISLCMIEVGAIPKDTQKNANRLQRVRVYDESDHLNKQHIPTGLGDIFKGTGGKYFILVCQPCDLVVRSGGFRRNNEKEDGRQLVPLLELEKKTNDNNEPDSLRKIKLKYFEPNSDYSTYVKLNKIHWVPIWILDLSVLNNDGKCLVASSDSPLPLLIPAWQERFSILSDRAEKVALQRAIILNASLQEIEDPGPALLRLPLNSPVKIDNENTRVESDPTRWRLAIHLTRQLRVRDPYSLEILSGFSGYLSRVATPQDIARF